MTVVGRGGREVMRGQFKSLPTFVYRICVFDPLRCVNGAKLTWYPARAPTACRNAPLTHVTNEPSSFPGPAEALHVVLDAGDEDVLHLQVAAGMEQRRGVDEAFRRAPREVEADVVRHLCQHIVQRRSAHALRQVCIVALVDRAQPLLEPEDVPDARPERHPLIVIADRFRSVGEQPLDRARAAPPGRNRIPP